MELETTAKVRDELKLNEEMATELKNVLNSFRHAGQVEAEQRFDNDPISGAPADKLTDKAAATMMSAESFLELSLAQLRTGARVLMIMSATMFLIGVGFLVLAAVRSFTHPDSVEVTAVIAGVGVVQISLLFYRNPLRDIRRSISNSQQATMVVMSYMLGVGLIAKSLRGVTTEKAQQALSTLTQQAFEQLEQVARWEARKGASDRKLSR